MYQSFKHFKTLLASLILALVFGTTASAQFPCTLSITQTPSPSNPRNISFGVTISGSNCQNIQFQYTWSFGDLSQGTGANVSHTYASSGIYGVCVNAIGGGLNLSACDTVIINDTVGANCNQLLTFTTYQATPTSTTIKFTNATVFNSSCLPPNPVFSYSFGDGSSATAGLQSITEHTYSQPGTYTVCLRTFSATNVLLQYCSQIVISNVQPPYVLSGSVLKDNQCLPGNVMVEIYGVNNNYYGMDSLNGSSGDSCRYFFSVPQSSGGPAGKYIIRATPLQNGSYISTYFGDALFWEDATVIEPVQSQYNLNINLLPNAFDTVGPTPGDGIVSGTISGNGTIVNASLNGVSTSTSFNVTASRVIIMNANHQPVGFAMVNADGTFSFPDLPSGDYFLRVDNPLVPSPELAFSISPSVQSIVVNMTTHASGISSVTSTAKAFIKGNLNAWPNPAHTRISLSGASGEVTFLDATGRVVLRTMETQNIRVDHLPAGLYTIRALGADKNPVSTRINRN